MKRFIASFLFFFLVGLSAGSAEQVIVERITEQEAEELAIEIPEDLEPGYHEVVIEIFEDEVVVGERIIGFCKSKSGEISWENLCPDLVESDGKEEETAGEVSEEEVVTPLVPAEELALISDREDLPNYDPVSEPEKTVDTQVATFAVLSVVAAGASALTQATTSDRNSPASSRRREDDKEKEDENEERESGDVASADSGKLKFAKRNLGRGDNSSIWQRGYRPELENGLSSAIERVSAFSPIFARILLDGSYLRAMISSYAFIPSIFAIETAFLTLIINDFQALPPTFFLMAFGIFLATIDAFAGLWLATLILLGTIITGNATTLDELMTSLGIAAILLTPGLVASAIRPFRRPIENLDIAWERATDYLLAILLGGWAVEKIVGSLNGLAGVQLAITASSFQLGLLASLFILVRLLLEDFATYLFPERLIAQEARTRDPIKAQPFVSLLVKTSLFALVSYQFLGLTVQLILGTILFIFPNLFKILTGGRDLFRTRLLFFLLPKGAPKIVIMVFIGTLFANWVQNLFPSAEAFILWSFVVLAIPGLILSLAGNFSTSPNFDWKKGKIGKAIYRIGGLFIAALIFAMYQGVNLYEFVFGR